MKSTEEHIKNLTDAFVAKTPIDYYGQQCWVKEYKAEKAQSDKYYMYTFTLYSYGSIVIQEANH